MVSECQKLLNEVLFNVPDIEKQSRLTSHGWGLRWHLGLRTSSVRAEQAGLPSIPFISFYFIGKIGCFATIIVHQLDCDDCDFCNMAIIQSTCEAQ